MPQCILTETNIRVRQLSVRLRSLKHKCIHYAGADQNALWEMRKWYDYFIWKIAVISRSRNAANELFSLRNIFSFRCLRTLEEQICVRLVPLYHL